MTYNARFDRRLLDQTRELYGLPPFGVEPEKFECAMVAYAEHVGEWSRHRGSFRWQPLNGGHRALGDCLAVLDVIKEMAAADAGEGK